MSKQDDAQCYYTNTECWTIPNTETGRKIAENLEKSWKAFYSDDTKIDRLETPKIITIIRFRNEIVYH